MRTPVLIVAVLLLISAVSAANVTLAPTSIYETTSVWETVDINNYRGNSVISEVEVETAALPVVEAESYLGWTKVQDGDSVLWKDGSIATNVKSAVFELKVTAPNVTENKVEIVKVSLNSVSANYNITILNDASPPVISNVQPSSYARANNPSQSVSATVTDPETSVSSVVYAWNDCGNGTVSNIAMIKNNDMYLGVADFSGFDEGDKVCYTLTATNVPGEKATKTGELLFDGTPPSVTINAPTTFATENTDFSFTASDNIATMLTCTLKLGSSELGVYNVSNGSVKTVAQDLSNVSEGSYTWSVTCVDGVGLSATHEQAIVLDTKPPVITIDYNPFLLRTRSGTFTATVTDTIGLASVSAELDGSNVTLSQSGDDYSGSISSEFLGIITLEVTAVDDAGHKAKETRTITVVPNHQLTLVLSPSTTTKKETVIASGKLTTDGNVTNDKVTVKTPGGDFNLELNENNEYDIPFSAPGTGTYTITTEYVEGNYTYKAEATLLVQSSSQSNPPSGSHGYGSNWKGGAGYVKPHPSETDSGSGDTNAVVPEEPEDEPENPVEQPEYEPLEPEQAREALLPKATGVFSLGKTVKWLALLLALALLIGIGVYAYKKRPKDDSGINWDGYFKGD